MKLHWFAFLLLAFSAGVRAAEPLARPISTNASGATNNVLITCDAGAQVTTNQAIFRKNVKAQDSQMYLECELLTTWYSSKSTNAHKPTTAASGMTSDAGDIDLVIAETNVMIITAAIQVIGDRAVYNASNDVLVVTGELVVALNAQGSFAGTNIVYNRRSGETYGDGPITTIFNGSLSRTNAPPPGPKPK